MAEIQKEINKLIRLYFKQPSILYEHLFSSFHQFIEEIIPYCLKNESNYFYENIDGTTIYYHSLKCDNVRIKPPTFDNDNEIKFPNDARKNHLNYFGTVIFDVKQIVEKVNLITGEKEIIEAHKDNDIAVANVPIMVKSKYCSTNIKKDSRDECKFDPGGYFIVNGAEKIVMSIEKMVDNKVLVFTKKDISYDNGLIYTAQINSRKNDWSDNLQIVTMKNKKDGVLTISTSQLLDVPLFILMRALGFENDHDIITNITYDIDDIKMINLLRPSISYCEDENGNQIKTKEEAINFLITKIHKSKKFSQTNENLAKKQKQMLVEKIIRKDLLHHLGEDIPKKRCFIGFMANKLLNCMLGRIDVDDRDALHNKRVETPGILLGQLFRQNWKKMLSEIGKVFRGKNTNDLNPINIIVQIKPTTIEQGIKTALATGVWGMQRTKNGVAQALQRLSWIQTSSYFRRIKTPMLDASTSSITSMRHVNNNQYKFLCCVTGDTEITLSDLTLKKIKYLNSDDIVLTVNKYNLSYSKSNIYNYFSITPDKLYKITTNTGNTIKATGDHPFLVKNKNTNEWVVLEKLHVDDELIMVKNNDMFVSRILKIESIPIETVYDFTTVNDNHSFIANNFVTHNCMETPEGQNIGIVKSLSMMSTITTQNNSQEKIIKTILDLNKNIKHPADINPLDMNKHVKIFINGEWAYVVSIKYSLEVYNNLKTKRRDNIIDKYVSILFDFDKKELKIYFDGGRLIRPLLIVENNELNITPEVIKDINEELTKTDINKGWKRIITKYHNIIEYEDIESCNYLMIALKQQKLKESNDNKNNKIEYTDSSKVNRYGDYKWVKYTHCEFHGWVMLGTTAANMAFVNHDYSTKSVVHFSQAKQSIGIYLTTYKDRMDISQVLYHPQVPIVQTEAMNYNNALDLPNGENAIVAIASYTGYNQEDSMVFNQSSIDRGIFRCDSLKPIHSEIVKNPSTSQDDIFTKPDPNKVTGMKQGNYSKLNDKGFVPEETEIYNNDIIIGKISPIQPTGDNNKVYKDSSSFFKSNVTGVIDRVHTGIYNSEGYEMYNVKVRMERIPMIGDKFCVCFFADVLTNKGWINITKITNKHKVAIYDPDLDTLVYEYPQEVHCFDYDSELDGKMYQLKSQLVDLTVTPNHRMYVKKRTTLENGKFDYPKDFDFMLAKDCFGKRLKYKKSISNFEPKDWIGNTFIIPQYKDRPEIKVNINHWLIFFGIWITKGYCNDGKIFITANKALEPVIRYMGFNISKSINKHCDELDIWNINNVQLTAFMEPLSIDATNRSLPEWVWRLNKEQAQLLIESMMLGNEHLPKSNPNLYYTSSTKLADDLSRLCIHAGWYAHYRKVNDDESSYRSYNNVTEKFITSNSDCLCVTIIKTKLEPEINHGHNKAQNGQSEEWIDYKGTVHCLTVRTGIFMVRENGKPVWTGNSNRHG
jgi:DNA-directed RNA polymerase beta subunit